LDALSPNEENALLIRAHQILFVVAVTFAPIVSGIDSLIFL
jgi:hypothetical protein